MGKVRIEKGYRATTNKDGEISVRIEKNLAERVRLHCQMNNLSKTKFVNECVQMRMDNIKREMMEQMTKEELIEMIEKQSGIIAGLRNKESDDKEQLSLNI